MGALAALAALAAVSSVPGPVRLVQETATPVHTLPVEMLPIRPQPGFDLVRVFSGRVQARRESDLGPETAGRLARVLVDEGDTVAGNQLLAEIDTERLRARRTELIAAQTEAKAWLTLAAATLARLRGIVDRGGVSRQALDEAHETQRATAAGVKLATQRVASVDVELAKSRLLAPFAGTVVARLADEGQVLDVGTPVVRLQELTTPEIRVGVAGRLVENLEVGRAYALQWRDGELRARLRALLPQRAAIARTVDALFDPVNPDPGLLPGDLVRLRLVTRVDEAGAWLPLNALTEGERGLWNLYVAVPDDSAPDGLHATHRIARRLVDLLHLDGDRVYVRGALDPRERVVATGLQRVVAGQWVRAAAPRLAQRRTKS